MGTVRVEPTHIFGFEPFAFFYRQIIIRSDRLWIFLVLGQLLLRAKEINEHNIEGLGTHESPPFYFYQAYGLGPLSLRERVRVRESYKEYHFFFSLILSFSLGEKGPTTIHARLMPNSIEEKQGEGAIQ
jgi:hypothetical protein